MKGSIAEIIYKIYVVHMKYFLYWYFNFCTIKIGSIGSRYYETFVDIAQLSHICNQIIDNFRLYIKGMCDHIS